MTTTTDRAMFIDESAFSRQFLQRFSLLLGLVAAVLALIAAAGGYAVARKATPTYRSAAAISLDQPFLIAASTDSGQIDKLSRIRQKYVGVVRFDSVITAVARQTGLPSGHVRGDVFALADRASLLLIVGANDHNPQVARRVTAAMANELVTYVNLEQTRTKIPNKDRIVATVVVQPKAAGAIEPTRRKEVTTAIVAGLVVFLAVVGLGSLTRRRPQN